MTDHLDTPVLDLEPSAEPAASASVIAEALSVIDGALAQMIQRDLVSTTEVADLLLDLRTMLVASTEG